ncbi:MAG: nitrogen regulation protein NR(II), partial [bacterium]
MQTSYTPGDSYGSSVRKLLGISPHNDHYSRSDFGTFAQRGFEQPALEIGTRLYSQSSGFNQWLVVVLAENGKIIRFNRASETISGYRAAEVLAHSYREMLILPEGIAEIILEKKTAPRLYHFEKCFQAKDGASRCVYWTVAKINSSNGQGSWTICTGVDITDRKLAQEERRQLEIQRMESQKLESLGLLAGSIAHDFNNLLVGILGNASIALMDLPEDSQIRESVQDIEKAALCVSELTKQMLDYSGKGKLHIQSLDLSILASEMAHFLESVVTKKAVLKIDASQYLPKIDGDAAQIRQVVMNLITNASDALGEKDGTIDVSTGVMEADPVYLAKTYLKSDLRAGEYVYIEVADAGCGMATETINRIFDPFYTT